MDAALELDALEPEDPLDEHQRELDLDDDFDDVELEQEPEKGEGEELDLPDGGWAAASAATTGEASSFDGELDAGRRLGESPLESLLDLEEPTPPPDDVRPDEEAPESRRRTRRGGKRSGAPRSSPAKCTSRASPAKRARKRATDTDTDDRVRYCTVHYT